MINHKLEFLEFACRISDHYKLSFPYSIYALSGSLEFGIAQLYDQYRLYGTINRLVNRINIDLRRSKKKSESLLSYNKFRGKLNKLKASPCVKPKLAVSEKIPKF